MKIVKTCRSRRSSWSKFSRSQTLKPTDHPALPQRTLVPSLFSEKLGTQCCGQAETQSCQNEASAVQCSIMCENEMDHHGCIVQLITLSYKRPILEDEAFDIFRALRDNFLHNYSNLLSFPNQLLPHRQAFLLCVMSAILELTVGLN